MLTTQPTPTKTPTQDLFAGILPTNIDKELQHYRKEVDAHPRDEKKWFSLGNAFANKGSAYMAEAIFCYTKALELKPDFSSALLFLLIANGRKAKPDADAVHFFVQASEVKNVTKQQQATLWINIASFLSKYQHKHDLFFHCNLYANMLDDTNLSAWQMLAMAYAQGYGIDKDPQRAQLCLDNIQRLNNKQTIIPLNPDKYYYNGIKVHISNGNILTPPIRNMAPTVKVPAAAAPFTKGALLPSLASLLSEPPAHIEPKKRPSESKDEQSEVASLKAELKLKQQRIDIMEAELKNKDAQLAAMRVQLERSRPR